MKIRKNDKVKIISGKESGKEVIVEKVLTKTDRVYLEGANIVKKHMKGKGIIEIPKSMDVSNVLLVCPKCSKTTRIGLRQENNKKVRYCKKCKETI